jgi:hypothetical protein
MAYEIDHDRRRAEFVAGPGFSGTALCKAVAAMFDGDPRSASYDLIFDVRASRTGVELADIQIVSEAYHRQTREAGVKISCFVSNDTNYHLLTTTMDHLFDDRSNKVFRTVEAARRYLDERRAT